MKIKFPFLLFPALVFFVDSLKPNTLGVTNLFFVRILTSEKDNPGILAHELNHVKNMYITSLINFALTLCGVYLYSPTLLMFLGEVNWLNVAMFYAGSLGTYGWLYMLSDDFRFWQECLAFKEQAKYDTVSKLEKYAKVIADKYNTGKTYEQALAKLKE